MPGSPSLALDQLSAFVAIADEGSFSRAARRLGVTKGTVSRALARLEASVGAELVHRNTHKVALSTAGVALYERTAPHLTALTQAVGNLPERAEAPSGVLRLTAPHDLGVVLLPAVAARFALRYPEVSFDIRLTNERLDLVAEGIDLAIRASPERLADSSLTVRRLGGADVRFYAAPAYVARRGEPREVGEARHDWVLFTPMQARLGLPRRFVPRFRVNDFFAVRDLLREGAGVGPLPPFIAEPYVQAGALVAALPAARVRLDGGYFVLSPAGRQAPRKVTAFRDFLVDACKAQPVLQG